MKLNTKEYYITVDRILNVLENKNEDEEDDFVSINLEQEDIKYLLILIYNTYIKLDGLFFKAWVSNFDGDLRLNWSNKLGTIILNICNNKSYIYYEYYKSPNIYDIDYQITCNTLSKYLLQICSKY